MSEDCSEFICSSDKDEKMMKEALSYRGGSLSSEYEGPLNAVLLGRATWPLLHKMSLSYPDNPTQE